MNLFKKIQKLFTGRAFSSASQHFRRFLLCNFTNSVKLPFPLTAENLFAEIDSAEFQRIKAQYGTTEQTPDSRKYISFPLRWLGVNIDRIRELELDFGPRRNILDIGCGVGYFLYGTQRLGHHAIGLDLDCDPIFTEMVSHLKVDRRVFRIEAFQPLPDFGCKLDLVTAHLICFNGHRTDAVWGIAEWKFFFTELAKQLKPNAKIFFEMNPEEGNQYLTKELHAYFEKELGAKISDNWRRLYFEHRKFAGALANG